MSLGHESRTALLNCKKRALPRTGIQMQNRHCMIDYLSSLLLTFNRLNLLVLNDSDTSCSIQVFFNWVLWLTMVLSTELIRHWLRIGAGSPHRSLAVGSWGHRILLTSGQSCPTGRAKRGTGPTWHLTKLGSTGLHLLNGGVTPAVSPLILLGGSDELKALGGNVVLCVSTASESLSRDPDHLWEWQEI